MSGKPHEKGLWVWGTCEASPRLLHTMLRVRDVAAACRFYCDGLGMRVLSRFDSELGRFSLLFISFTDFNSGAAIELTHNWDVTEPYDHGTAFGHVAIGVADVAGMCQRLEDYGGVVTVPPKRMVAGAPRLAFVKDPEGYSVELIQTDCRVP